MYIPVIRDDECTNCRACERICPKLVFGKDKKEVCVADPSKCTGCGSCCAVCLVKAIEVKEM
jgi:NAD-dependent dihydropyrimidine dehydrogenase PreA subunit